MHVFQEEKDTLKNFLPDTDFKKYVDSLEKNGTYADHVAIKAVCEMLKCKLRIVSSSSDADILLGPTTAATTLTVGYLTDAMHYVSLESTT